MDRTVVWARSSYCRVQKPAMWRSILTTSQYPRGTGINQ